MGTNYYAKIKPDHPRYDYFSPYFLDGEDSEGLHIGKSSMGWCFSLHVIPEIGITSLEDWKRVWGIEGVWIENEYGDVIGVDDMLNWITNRSAKDYGPDWSWEAYWDQVRHNSHMQRYCDLDHWLDCNHAIKGPKGLLQHRIGEHCFGHAPDHGTWSLITGEFS